MFSVLTHRLPHITQRESEALTLLLESAFIKILSVVQSSLDEDRRSEMMCYALSLWGVFSFGSEGEVKFPELVKHVVDMMNVYVECCCVYFLQRMRMKFSNILSLRIL